MAPENASIVTLFEGEAASIVRRKCYVTRNVQKFVALSRILTETYGILASLKRLAYKPVSNLIVVA
jgi:hypothetical protein